MNTKFKLIAASLAAPLAIGLATPAMAQHGNWDRGYDRADQRDYRDARGTRAIERKLTQLRSDIRRAQRSGQLTRHEAWSVRSRLDAAERAYAALARNGISRSDVRTVSWRIDQAYDALHHATYNSANRYNQRDYRRGYRSARR